jgi:hypothetical protein
LKLTASNFPIYLLTCASLTTLNVPVLQGESHCPGNIASVTPRLIANALMVVPVMVNHKGPFDFMVDTGSQITVVDPSLASQLDLKPEGTVGLVAAASFSRAPISVLDSLEAGSQLVGHPLAIIHDLGQIKAADSRVRGVLGEDFLSHFDILLDYGHKMFCLDASSVMRDKVRGEHISLVSTQDSKNGLPFAQRLVVAVRLSGAGSRQVLLQLDSGSDGPVLYQTRGESRLPLLDRATLRSGSASAAERAFAALPPQDLRIGGRTVSQVPFVTPMSVGDDVPKRAEDGLLPTVMFLRVFISGTGHYVVLELR